LIIDCHGHYTTVPAGMVAYRQAQLDHWKDPSKPAAILPSFSDDQLRETLENAQLKLLRERGIDLTIFSPRASAMAPHVGSLEDNIAWARSSNDLIHRVCTLYPKNFAGVCQLPQTNGTDLKASIAELERCVNELGFVGCNLNPDPSGGHFSAPPLTDKYWYPIYEKMVELNVPAMVHVSGSCNPVFHATGAFYISADTTAFMQFIEKDLFADFPELRLIIPHGGGAVPYHWGRYRGLAQDMKRPPLEESVLKNVFFDTCVYHLPGIELLLNVIPLKNILFGSEMVGAVRGIDPRTGQYYDDTKKYVDALGLDDATRAQLFETNAYHVYPRLEAQIAKQLAWT
jgi:4-oxalmesaconate hydratase